MKSKYLLGFAVCSLVTAFSLVFAQGPAFTYNGFLSDLDGPVTGSRDLKFTLFDASTLGLPVGSQLLKPGIAVDKGVFSVPLNFGPSFTGPDRWLEIEVSLSGAGAFTLLSPRQAITPTPYAIMANSASNLLGTLPAAQLKGSLPISQVSGTLPLTQLPASVVLNNSSGVNLTGTFTGNGAGVTDVNLITANSQGAISWTTNFFGTFATVSSPPVGPGPKSVFAADVNGDGKADLISANSANNTLSVLLNDGSGGFGPATSVGVGSAPFSVTAARLTGNPWLDLISANSGNSTLSVLLNNGSGGFVLHSSPSVGLNTGPRSVAAADVDGDGDVDLISANFANGTLSVLLNDGSGNFVLDSSPSVGAGPRSVVAADVNGDPWVDLVCANVGPTGSGSTLSVLLNNGNGKFGNLTSLVVGSGPISLTAADVNGDLLVDLITANYGNGNGTTLSVLLKNNNGSGFLSAVPITVGIGPTSVAVAEVNGDIRVDLICANFGNNGNGTTLSVLTNNGSGGFLLASSPIVGNGPMSVATALLNGDNRADLVSANFNGNSLTVLFNTPSSFRAPAFFQGNFSGNGGDLINLNAANLIGAVPSASLTSVPAGSLTGTLLDARLSANVALLNATRTITANWINTANPWDDTEVTDNLTIASGVINNTPIGQTTAAAGAFTTLAASGTFIVSGNVTLCDAATRTLTINAGPVNLPNATTAADALVFGTDVNLYRSAPDTLKTDDSLLVNGLLKVDQITAASALAELNLGSDRIRLTAPDTINVIAGTSLNLDASLGVLTLTSGTINLIADVNLNLDTLLPAGAITTGRAISGTVAKLGSASSGATPSVNNLTVLVLENYTAPTSITDLLNNGVEGQTVVLVGGINPVVPVAEDNGTSPNSLNSRFKLKSNTDWTANRDDTLTVCRVNGVWLEISRSDN